MDVRITECPRDAMQGISEYIPVELKVKYLNSLLRVGFDTLDFGSFVSPAYIPQLRDTAEVLSLLDLSGTDTQLLAIVANLRGASEAVKHEEIKYLGFPFSISETFQVKNVNATIKESLGRVEDIQIVLNICEQFNKEMIVYISMAFGNPYGDPWSEEIIYEWTSKLAEMHIRKIALSDTVGNSNPESIRKIFTEITGRFPEIEFGAHFHTSHKSWEEKVRAAYESGCRNFDGAILGFGGCPLSGHELVGNMPTENLFAFFHDNAIHCGINTDKFFESIAIASEVFAYK